MKAPGLVKEELRRILLKTNQFRHEITKIRVSTFWMSGKATDSRRAAGGQHSPLTHFDQITAPQTRRHSKNAGFKRRQAPKRQIRAPNRQIQAPNRQIQAPDPKQIK